MPAVETRKKKKERNKNSTCKCVRDLIFSIAQRKSFIFKTWNFWNETFSRKMSLRYVTRRFRSLQHLLALSQSCVLQLGVLQFVSLRCNNAARLNSAVAPYRFWLSPKLRCELPLSNPHSKKLKSTVIQINWKAEEEHLRAFASFNRWPAAATLWLLPGWCSLFCFVWNSRLCRFHYSPPLPSSRRPRSQETETDSHLAPSSHCCLPANYTPS